MKVISTTKGSGSCIVAGIMSGTSLDGVDVAFCSFEEHKGNWHYEILAAKTFAYNKSWRKALTEAPLLEGEALVRLDREYGNYLGSLILSYISRTGITPQLIASHGHTVFHSPGAGYSYQLGHGANIAAGTGIPVVYDFRSADIAKEGQGAPLVPVGDKLLFAGYDSCLNLGGFANISFDWEEERIAFDICPVNTILNRLAQKNGQEYDKNGLIGRQGKVEPGLLKVLNRTGYYRKGPPKSLSREWLESEFFRLFDRSGIRTEDKLATAYDHMAYQISQVLNNYKIKKVLVTGGGAFNRFLISRCKLKTDAEIILPEKTIIKYKEALVFACLGLLRVKNQINCLASVTGAASNSVCGAIVVS